MPDPADDSTARARSTQPEAERAIRDTAVWTAAVVARAIDDARTPR